MRLRVEAAPPSTWAWLPSRTGCAITSDWRAVQAVDSRGWVRGQVGFCNWTRRAVQLHMAVESPIVWRSLLPAALGYAFDQADMWLCLGVVPAGNWRSMRFAQRAGFFECHRVRDGWDAGEDLVMLQLHRAQWETLKRRFLEWTTPRRGVEVH